MIGTIVLVEAVKYFIWIGPYVFATYLGAPWVIFHEVAQGVPYEWFPQTWKIIAVPAVYCVVLFAGGLLIGDLADVVVMGCSFIGNFSETASVNDRRSRRLLRDDQLSRVETSIRGAGSASRIGRTWPRGAARSEGGR